MRITFLLMCILLASVACATAQDERSVGLVKTVSGEATIEREGKRMTALPGSGLMLGDLLVTGASGTLGVILKDDTVLSLGPSSQTRIEQFSFDPAGGKLGMVLRVSRGVIEYLSGKISKLAPGSVRIETPVATLGIRGTHLLARIEP